MKKIKIGGWFVIKGVLVRIVVRRPSSSVNKASVLRT